MNQNPFGSVRPTSTCRISKLLICEVLPQHNQYLRPYQADTSVDVVRQLESIVSRPGNVTPQSLASIPNGFLSPSATPHSKVNIVNGWNEKRFRFMMEVIFESGFTTKAEIICGFTDYPGISLQSNHLDPDMVFYINSIVPMLRRVTNTEYGPIEQFIPSHPSHMIGKDIFGDGVKYHLMTPQAVLNQLVTSHYDYSQNMFDISSVIGGASFSNRNNTNALRYSSKMLTNYKDEAITDSHSLHGLSPKDLFSNVRGRSFEELSVGTDQFIGAIGGSSGETNRTWFQFKELVAIDPNVVSDQITQVVLLSNRVIPIEHTNHLAGADRNTQSAINIANILPTIMLDYGIVSLSVSSTNNVIGTSIQTFITSIQSLSGSSVDLSPIAPTLVNRINEELIRVISFNNQIQYKVDIKCDLIGETTIMLSYDNEIEVPYIIPTFADTLFNPILTDNKNQFNQVVNGFSHMFESMNSWIDGNRKHIDFNNIVPFNPVALNDL